MGYLDDNGLLYLWNKIKTLLANKVDKVSGKQLSTNDYSAAEKNKLSGIADNATRVIVEQSIVNESSNPLAGKVVQQMLKNVIDGVEVLAGDVANKVDKEIGKGLSTNDYTTAEKTKLSGIAEGANKTIVDSAWSTTSLNPVQNKLITTRLDNLDEGVLGLVNCKVDKEDGKQLSTHDYTSAEKTKLAGLTNFTHPNTEGNKHVPATGTTNNGKALIAGSTAGAFAWQTLTKSMVGLGSVDNTSDIDKPISSAMQIALDNKAGTGTVTTSRPGLMSVPDKVKLDAFGNAGTYALKADIVGMYKYKGSVADASKLPTTGQTTGDVYNIVAPSIYGAAGANVAWDGSKWDSLGEIFTITSITNAQIDTICA